MHQCRGKDGIQNWFLISHDSDLIQNGFPLFCFCVFFNNLVSSLKQPVDIIAEVAFIQQAPDQSIGAFKINIIDHDGAVADGFKKMLMAEEIGRAHV